jgi:hypothetical protein
MERPVIYDHTFDCRRQRVWRNYESPEVESLNFLKSQIFANVLEQRLKLIRRGIGSRLNMYSVQWKQGERERFSCSFAIVFLYIIFDVLECVGNSICLCRPFLYF